MDKSILEYIYKKLNYEPTIDEQKKHEYDLMITINQKLITEKIVNKSLNNFNDNYNLGNYYILKEKDAEVSHILFPENFIKKYITNDTDKEVIQFLKNKNLNIDTINKYLIIYDNIKFILKTNKYMKNINKYIIEDD